VPGSILNSEDEKCENAVLAGNQQPVHYQVQFRRSSIYSRQEIEDRWDRLNLKAQYRDWGLIPFKSTAFGRATLEGYADPERILAKGSIPFRVSRFPLKIIMGNGKRETKKLRIPFTPGFTGQAKATSSRRGRLLRKAAGFISHSTWGVSCDKLTLP
jgi:hypothetical protein